MHRKTKVKKARSRRIKKVKLPTEDVLHVIVPKDVQPLVSSESGIVEIVPIKRDHKKKSTWWNILFGVD